MGALIAILFSAFLFIPCTIIGISFASYIFNKINQFRFERSLKGDLDERK